MIPYALHSIDSADIRAITSVLGDGKIARGDATREFEDRVAQIANKKHGIAFANGTVALWAAIRCLNHHLEDTLHPVHSTTLTFSAVANAVLLNGNNLTLHDVTENVLCGDLSGYHTDIAVPMDYAGYPHQQVWIDPDQIVVRDACHSLCHDRDWSSDDMTIFSFHPSKQITCGEGGMIVTDNGDWAEELCCLRDNGRMNGIHVELGLNLHIDELGAVLGLSQLTRLDKIIERRRELANAYSEHWKDDPRLILHKNHPQHAWHLYVIRLTDKVKCTRDQFREDLLQRGVGTQIHYRPLHQQPVIQRIMADEEKYPVADLAYWRMMSIPLYYGLSDAEQKYVIGIIDEVLDRYAEAY